MPELDKSQIGFCRSTAKNIRLLAPAGCGKTSSLLYRCTELVKRGKSKPRFLIVTFTVAAANELNERLQSDPAFENVRGQANITTLNAYGWQRIRSQVSSPQLLNDSKKRYFAMRNQLRPVWLNDPHINRVAGRAGRGPRVLMEVMDNLKSLGFDHTRDINLTLLNDRLETLERQGLAWRINQQLDLLASIDVMPRVGPNEKFSTNRKEF